MEPTRSDVAANAPRREPKNVAYRKKLASMNNKPDSFVPLIQVDRQLRVKIVASLLGASLLAVSAQIDIPMVPVPMSLQTYALLVIAALFGSRWGALTVGVYLTAAVLGLPVLTDGVVGQFGVSRLLGPTAGYLFGFLVAAFGVGNLAERGWTTASFVRSCGVMLIAHGVILTMGVARLSWLDGYDLARAFSLGAAPFALGAIAKSVLASGTILWLHQRKHVARDRR